MEDINGPIIGRQKQTTTYVYGQASGGPVVGLNPNTDYRVTLQMFNTAGQTDPSQWQVIGTYLDGKNLLLHLASGRLSEYI